MPSWRAFDAKAARVLSLTSGRGRLVFLATTADFRSQREAWTLAMSVGRNWAASGALVVLADGCFEDPRLDSLAHLPNDGGLVDVLFLGTSLQEVVQPGGRHAFHLLTTGADASEPLPRIVGARWDRLLEEIHSHALTFAVLAPMDSELGEWALSHSTDIVVLADADDDIEGLFAEGEERVREVIGPPWRRLSAPKVLRIPPATGVRGARALMQDPDADPRLVRQIKEFYEREANPDRRRRSGRERRVTPDRRERMWREAADSHRRRAADLPDDGDTDRRRADRRSKADRRKSVQPEDAFPLGDPGPPLVPARHGRPLLRRRTFLAALILTVIALATVVSVILLGPGG